MIRWIKSWIDALWREPAPHRSRALQVLVSVHHASGRVEVGRVDWWGADFAMVHPHPAGLARNQLPWTFDRATGRHITWGQGRHDLECWPRVEPRELAVLWTIAPDGGS